ncbi:MAG: hypothetical protein AAF653_00770 [Chloroflexota bacterium]
MTEDPEMEFMNQMFRSELEKFKGADEATRRQVVAIIAEANALDWLIEVCDSDDDPQIRAYADIAREQ